MSRNADLGVMRSGMTRHRHQVFLLGSRACKTRAGSGWDNTAQGPPGTTLYSPICPPLFSPQAKDRAFISESDLLIGSQEDTSSQIDGRDSRYTARKQTEKTDSCIRYYAQSNMLFSLSCSMFLF